MPERILEKARSTGRHESEGWRVRKDGSRFWADVVITALREDDGTLVGFGKVTRDLTSRQLATEQMRAGAAELRMANAELEQFRLLVTSVRDYAIFVLDVTGRIRTWNPGAERIKGYSADEVIGRHFELFYTDEARARRHPDHELRGRGARGPLRGGGLARPQGRHAVLGQRRHHRPARRARRPRRLRQGHARPDRAPQGAAAAGGIRAPGPRWKPSASASAAAALETVTRAIVARLDLDEILQTAIDAAIELTGAATGHVERGFTGDGVIMGDDATRSSLAVPIRLADGEIAGGLCFGHPEPDAFDAEAAEAALSIASAAAVAIGNARLLEAARQETAAREVALQQRDQVALALQQSLLPPELPEIPGLELGAHYHAGTELVGGDFYDVFALTDTTWGIVLGDVCGSGPEAASQTALTRHTVRTAAMFDAAPAAVLHALNRALLRANTERFTTGVFVRLDLAAEPGEIVASIASAGHPRALIVRADGRIEESPARGILLGVMDFPIEALHVVDHRLAAGDTLILYTDGLTEARRDRVLFDVDGVMATLEALHGAPVRPTSPTASSPPRSSTPTRR